VARSDGRRLRGELAFLSTVVALACSPRVSLERLPCPCVDTYRCCESEQICYPPDKMPAGCAPAGLGGPSGGGGADAGGAGGGAGAGSGSGTGGGDGGADAAGGAGIDGDVDAGGTADAGGGGASGGAGSGGASGIGGSGGGGASGIGGSGDGGASGIGGSGGGGASGSSGSGDGGASGSGGSGGGGASGSGGAGSGGASGSGGSGGGGAPVVERSTVDGFFPPPPAILGTGTWRFTTTAPTGNWTQPSFIAAGWQTGRPGFFGEAPLPGDNQQTPWPEGAPELWLRTTFRIEQAEISRALLWGRWDDGIEVYINGTLAATDPNSTQGYRYLGLNAAALTPGIANTLAVHITDSGGARYLDLAVALNDAFAAMPMSGSERTPALAAYADAVRWFMLERGIPGGVLAVMKKDQVVVKRGFGWADKSFTRPMSPDAVMRLGGPELLVTAGAVVTLIDAGTVDPVTQERISRDTRVFPLLRAHGLAPLPGRTPAPEIDDVTVRMLLDGTSGISELSGDPGQIYADLGVAPGSPTTAADNVRWVYSMPLVHAPGAAATDGATASMLLRHLVHVVTGDLLGFLRTAVFGPAGTSDVFIAHEALALRDAREPGYVTLETPYDRWMYLDNFTALATTAEAFVRYLRRYHGTAGTLLIDPETHEWAARPDNGGLLFFGVMQGTWTAIVQRRYDEVSYAIYFNIGGEYGALIADLESVTDSLSDADWGL
jgi:CubicO group peptidase (beta-lactamase class C family)